MNIVKLTCPVEWNIDLPDLKTQFHRMTPGLSAIWGNYTFAINDDTNECDYWLVYGFLEKEETVIVKKKSILLLSEEIGIKRWDDKFMQQFDVVIGSQTNVNHPNYIHDHYACGWQVQKSFDQLVEIKSTEKSKLLSIIASDVQSTDGHRKRYAFVKQLSTHFGERVDWFGKGNNFINDKWDGLHNYKFSVAIENQKVEDYFTEKITDCFLAYTIPFYYGCPDIEKYFPKGSYVNIDLENISQSLDIIEKVISGNFYEKNFAALQEARELVLKRYQMVSKVTEWLDAIDENTRQSRQITLYSELNYIKTNFLNKLKRRVYKVIYK